MRLAQRKHVKKVLADTADTLDVLVAAIRQRGLDQSDPELGALADEALVHRNKCIRTGHDIRAEASE